MLTRSTLSPFIFSVSTFIILAGLGWLGIGKVETEMKNQLAERLQSTLNPNVEALDDALEPQP